MSNENGQRKRPYLRHGLGALQTAIARATAPDWTEQFGPAGVALREYREDLIQALGGDEVVSPQQREIIEICTRTHLMLESVDRYILGMRSLVNKNKRALYAVVTERMKLADALTRYLQALGLERRAKSVPSLAEIMREEQTGT
jgi:hypothetical protein